MSLTKYSVINDAKTPFMPQIKIDSLRKLELSVGNTVYLVCHKNLYSSPTELANDALAKRAVS